MRRRLSVFVVSSTSMDGSSGSRAAVSRACTRADSTRMPASSSKSSISSRGNGCAMPARCQGGSDSGCPKRRAGPDRTTPPTLSNNNRVDDAAAARLQAALDDAAARRKRMTTGNNPAPASPVAAPTPLPQAGPPSVDAPRATSAAPPGAGASASQTAGGRWFAGVQQELQAKHKELFPDSRAYTARREPGAGGVGGPATSLPAAPSPVRAGASPVVPAAAGAGNLGAPPLSGSLFEAVLSGGLPSPMYRGFLGLRTMFLALPLFPVLALVERAAGSGPAAHVPSPVGMCVIQRSCRRSACACVCVWGGGWPARAPLKPFRPVCFGRSRLAAVCTRGTALWVPCATYAALYYGGCRWQWRMGRGPVSCGGFGVGLRVCGSMLCAPDGPASTFLPPPLPNALHTHRTPSLAGRRACGSRVAHPRSHSGGGVRRPV